MHSPPWGALAWGARGVSQAAPLSVNGRHRMCLSRAPLPAHRGRLISVPFEAYLVVATVVWWLAEWSEPAVQSDTAGTGRWQLTGSSYGSDGAYGDRGYAAARADDADYRVAFDGVR